MLMYNTLRSITAYMQALTPRISWHTFKTTVHYVSKQITTLLSPPRCAHCALLLACESIFCISCTQKIMPIVSHSIRLSKSYTMTIFAISDYREPIRSLILAKSRSDITASKQLGTLIWMHTPLRNMPIDCLIPIPLHWTRFAHRGYNQADEIAQILAHNASKPVIHAIKRTKRTQFQSKLTHGNRLDNVRDAFTINYDGSYFHNKHIVFVDDLMTTGATLQALAKMIIKHKPASISAVVACRVV